MWSGHGFAYGILSGTGGLTAGAFTGSALRNCSIFHGSTVTPRSPETLCVPFDRNAADTTGLRVESTWDSLGMRATRSDDLHIDVTVPAATLLGGVEGLALVVAQLMPHWLVASYAAVYVGVARAAVDAAVAHARERGLAKLPAVGNTVDVADAIWTNTIGDPELIAVWQDPDFDPKLKAFYYARVIEIPTPRWTAYDAKRFNVKMPPEVPMTVQERAYTSPIWYTP